MRKASSGLGVYDGLKVAWKLGAGKVLLEVDNLAVVKVLGGSGDETELNVVCRSIKEMLKRNWEVQVHHTYWEGNALAVVMANIAFSNPFGVQIYNKKPVEVSDVGRCDRDEVLLKPEVLLKSNEELALKRFASGRRRVIRMWSWTQFRLQENLCHGKIVCWVNQLIIKDMACTVVIKLLGKSIGYSAFYNKYLTVQLWQQL
ncbi:hypothetical protein CXB51_034054 [Gossypium anomalum]|uniref:RNase H type-1 domain-containing protein n=1 Tax=Gossypium anomalum TaxID=47600 RepID=A0A8J5XQ05_9ROSI|nr:hypothetical protein CXB51_034054 [Gossypium anomalum]